MKALYGLYPDPDSAQRGVNTLRAAGVEARKIQVISSEPFDEYEFGRRDARTPMPWLAVLGGLLGGTSGYLLAALTQKGYAIPTGGLPLVPLFTDGIIVYELTMLGAILASLLTLLVSARLPNWWSRPYDPAVAEGLILVGVLDPEESARSGLEKVFRESGARQVKEFVRR